jgi:urease accessory protein
MRAVLPREIGVATLRQSRAALRFRFAGGRSYLAEQFAGYPFHVTRPFQLDPLSAPALATVYLQSSSGGLYGGDDLRLAVCVEEGASAEVTSQASTVVHDARGEVARHSVELRAERDAFLAYWPDPAILLPGARLRQSVSVSLGAGATVLLADAFLTHDPRAAARRFERLESEVVVRDDQGRPLVADRLHVDGRHWDMALGGRHEAAATAMLLGMGEGLSVGTVNSTLDVPGIFGGAGLLPDNAGIGVRVLARDGVALSAALRRLWEVAFAARFGAPPSRRRK